MSFRGVSKGSVGGEADREPVFYTSGMIAVVVLVFVVFAAPVFSYMEKEILNQQVFLNKFHYKS